MVETKDPAPVPAPRFTGSVSLSKCISLAEIYFLLCKMGELKPSVQAGRENRDRGCRALQTQLQHDSPMGLRCSPAGVNHVARRALEEWRSRMGAPRAETWLGSDHCAPQGCRQKLEGP